MFHFMLVLVSVNFAMADEPNSSSPELVEQMRSAMAAQSAALEAMAAQQAKLQAELVKLQALADKSDDTQSKGEKVLRTVSVITERQTDLMCSTNPADLRAAGAYNVMRIFALQTGADKWVGRKEGVMILVEKHGKILAPAGGREVYADLDHNDKPDTAVATDGQAHLAPYVALHPTGDVYCAADPLESIILHYLVPSDSMVGSEEVWTDSRKKGGNKALYSQGRSGRGERVARGGLVM